jgi:hypothetical protein
MFLRVGKILRFHGPNAESDLAAAASELRGGCRRDGNNLVITRPKKMVFVDHFPLAPGFSAAGNGAPAPIVFERQPNEE